MRLLATCVVILTALVRTEDASAAPVPESKAAYVGTWEGTNMRLKISQDGRISYRRTGSELNVDVNIELSAFEGDSFIAGVGPLRTVFNVSRPPHVKGSTKRMVVDGVELAKVD